MTAPRAAHQHPSGPGFLVPKQELVLVPKLLLGNGRAGSSASRTRSVKNPTGFGANGKQSFPPCVPKQELGNERDQPLPGPSWDRASGARQGCCPRRFGTSGLARRRPLPLILAG